MPPAAATECERTGWTLLMIATVAPASAAARAARWPAKPAPMIRTSCEGIGPRRYLRDCGGERSPDLLDREHAAQDALPVDGHHRAEAPQGLGADDRLERLVGADRVARREDLVRGEHRPAGVDRLGDVLALGDP